MEYGLNENTIDQIRQVFSRYPEIGQALLYGSRAKGNFKTGSDIDLTLIGDQLNQKILNKIEDDIDELMLPYSFDLSILKQVSNQDFVDHVNRVGIVFYDRKTMVMPTQLK
ncbi:MAG TPA: nucleotidyltransferase domain-containing protein [Prolixibacteraceae bacterium]|jgi:predicted nucleotidyltransferase